MKKNPQTTSQPILQNAIARKLIVIVMETFNFPPHTAHYISLLPCLQNLP